MPDLLHKRCLGCEYILDHLSQPRCPECGRDFNPADATTFRMDNPMARRRADIQMAALATVTAMLFITVPWMACLQLRLLGSIWLAALAGGGAVVFTLVVAAVYYWRPGLLAVATVGPACALVGAQAWSHRQWLSFTAVLMGPALAMAVRAAWAKVSIEPR